MEEGFTIGHVVCLIIGVLWGLFMAKALQEKKKND